MVMESHGKVMEFHFHISVGTLFKIKEQMIGSWTIIALSQYLTSKVNVHYFKIFFISIDINMFTVIS